MQPGLDLGKSTSCGTNRSQGQILTLTASHLAPISAPPRRPHLMPICKDRGQYTPDYRSNLSQHLFLYSSFFFGTTIHIYLCTIYGCSWPTTAHLSGSCKAKNVSYLALYRKRLHAPAVKHLCLLELHPVPLFFPFCALSG